MAQDPPHPPGDALSSSLLSTTWSRQQRAAASKCEEIITRTPELPTEQADKSRPGAGAKAAAIPCLFIASVVSCFPPCLALFHIFTFRNGRSDQWQLSSGGCLLASPFCVFCFRRRLLGSSSSRRPPSCESGKAGEESKREYAKKQTDRKVAPLQQRLLPSLRVKRGSGRHPSKKHPWAPPSLGSFSASSSLVCKSGCCFLFLFLNLSSACFSFVIVVVVCLFVSRWREIAGSFCYEP